MVMGVLDKLTKAQQLMENIATATSKGKYSEAASSLIMLEEAFKQSTCEREEEVGCFFLFFFTTVLSHWDFSHWKFRLLSPGKPAVMESHYPTYGACWTF